MNKSHSYSCTSHVWKLVETNMEDLPSFCWLHKLHKNPNSKRFIAASHIKSLSKLLTTCFTYNY